MSDASRAEQLARFIALLPVDQRVAALDAACHDDVALRQLVERILTETVRRADVKGASGIASGDGSAEAPRVARDSLSPTGEYILRTSDATPSSATERAGPSPQLWAGATVAGKYRLIQVIGEGGMGAVWLADQTEPVKRQVAIKFIKDGSNSRDVVARFESERQALAVMNHPHIAKILDGGTVEGLGVPFFVMELVKGVPITKFCDQRRLSPRERLELFIPVCEAIQHAHQKGIIHRDIKPSNILVDLEDGIPIPKVIDFGVAKALGPALTDKTLNTMLGAVVGTPQYMSPEQAEANQVDIDTRSDIYSLGIVLYELLTGSPPFDARRLGRAAILEILRIIREVDPPTPSSKLSTDEGLPSISADRNTDPIRLTRLIRGELDWIVMKALEKDRTRRYESASGFAGDIRRYLAGEQVLAAPPSRVYRFRKFLRANRGTVLAVCLIGLALVVGMVGTTIGLWKADAERAQALEAKAKESIQREQAEIATAQAFAALQSFTDEFVERQFAAKSRLTENDRAILRKAVAQWEQFANSRGDTAQARDIRAEGAYRVAVLRHRLGESAAAETGYRSAIAILTKLVDENPADARYLQRLTSSQLGLGTLLRNVRRFDESLAEMDAALQTANRLVATDPESPDYRRSEALVWNGKGVVLRAAGKVSEAQAAYDRARTIEAELVAAHPDKVDLRQALAVSHNNQGNLSLADGNLPEAAQHFLAGLAIRQRLADEFPGSAELQLELSQSHYGLADLELARGDVAEATRRYQLSLELVAAIHAQQPLVPEYRDALADLNLNVGSMLNRQGDATAAVPMYQRAVEVRERMVVDFPNVPDYRYTLASDRMSLSGVLLATNERDRAERELKLATEALEALLRADPAERAARAGLALSREQAGKLAALRGDPATAQAKFQESLQIRLELARDVPDEPDYARDVLNAYMRRAEIELERMNVTAAIQEYLAGAEFGERLEAGPLVDAEHLLLLSRIRQHLGNLFEAQRMLPAAREQYQRAIRTGEQLITRQPHVASHRYELAGSHNNLATLLGRLQEPALAVAQLESALAILGKLAAEQPADVRFLIQLSGCQINRAQYCRNAGDPAAALVFEDQAIAGLEKVLDGKPNHPVASSFLRNGLQGRATSLDGLQRHGEAGRDWERLSKLVSGADRILYVSRTAQSLARTEEAARATELAESLADVDQPPTIFARARVFALLYGRSQDETHARRSVELLRVLVSKGFNDTNRLRVDPDLAAIRDYEGLQTLIAELEKP